MDRQISYPEEVKEHIKIWAKKMINKPIQEVEKINHYSISSIKQKLIINKNK